MSYPFEKTAIWQRTLARQDDKDVMGEARERLRTAFINTRKNVEPLVAQIGKELPQLTVHDITHLDALWEVADVLIGPDYPINPAEAFVLGMSFLLHDAATSMVAYPEGIQSLKSTVEWKDLVAQRGYSDSQLQPGKPEFQATVFEVLRLLHPKQAERLLTQSWKGIDEKPRVLLEDTALRNHYGAVIGQIAHSHWWYPEQVEEKWGHAPRFTPHASLNIPSNADWTVDQLKIALILRCSDAAHIDSRRAPDMLAALAQPNGYSRLHWHFQNRLGSPAVTNNKQSKLYWSAGIPFDKAESDSWWLCFDTAKMIDKEIRAANKLLEHGSRCPFKVSGVLGTDDIAEFVQYVPVQGWKPFDVGFKVSHIADIVDKFGGAELYGDAPWKALRELIQNASDAIRARRAFRKLPGNAGRIEVALTQDDAGIWLQVTDTGIGMSRYVLTEVLLDFGRSLWDDSALRTELPGLPSSDFKSVGKFGIGFLSVFMLGDEVKVTSWRDGSPELEQLTLHIPRGVRSRPVTHLVDPDTRLQEYGTRVAVRLPEGMKTLLGNDNHWKNRVTPMNLGMLVGFIAPTLDIDIHVCELDSKNSYLLSKANDWQTLPDGVLLERILHKKVSWENSPLLKIEEESGAVMGRARLGAHWYGQGSTLLTHRGITVGFANSMSGILLATNNHDLARSSATPQASSRAMTAWSSLSCKQATATDWFDHRHASAALSLGVTLESLVATAHSKKFSDSTELKNWFQNHGEKSIILVFGKPSTPEWCSSREMADEFSFHANVIDLGWSAEKRTDFGLGAWVGSLLPSTEGARTTSEAFTALLTSIWPDGVYRRASIPVGSVEGRDVDGEGIVFYPNSMHAP